MAEIWPTPPGAKAVTISAKTAIAARGRSGARFCAMPSTAWATMATATSLRPCRSPSPAGPFSAPAPKAKSVMAIAEGSVKPAQAASPPR